MNTWRLFRWVLMRGVVCGMIFGAIFGFALSSIYALTGALWAFIVGLFFGAALGVFLGGFVGIINGVALVMLTRLCFTPPRSLRLFRWSALLLSLLVTVVGCLIWIAWILIMRVEVILPITLFATIAAAYFAWRMPDAVVAHVEQGRHPLTNAVLFYIEK